MVTTLAEANPNEAARRFITMRGGSPGLTVAKPNQWFEEFSVGPVAVHEYTVLSPFGDCPDTIICLDEQPDSKYEGMSEAEAIDRIVSAAGAHLDWIHLEQLAKASTNAADLLQDYTDVLTAALARFAECRAGGR